MASRTNVTAEDAKRYLTENFKVIASFLYFVMKYCWIEDKITSQAIRFNLWPMQRAIVPKIANSLRLLILKARQLGLTWLIACYCLWRAITKPLQEILVISIDEDIAKEFLERVNFVRHRLPPWMMTPVVRDGTEVLEFRHKDENGNEINSVIKSLPTTPKGAQSKTPTLLVVDEACWNRYFKQIYVSSKPGLDAAKAPIIVISNTVKYAPGWPFMRQLYSNALKGLNAFETIFLPWWARPDRSQEMKYSEDDGKEIPEFIYNLKTRDEFNDDDISEQYPSTEEEAISAVLGSFFGKTLSNFKGRKGKKGRLVFNDDGFNRQEKEELREKSFNDLNSLIPELRNENYSLTFYKKSEWLPFKFVEERQGILEIWEMPVPGYEDRYGIGSDVGEGLGYAYSAAYVYDRVEKKFVARLRSNRVDADIWADELQKLGWFYGKAMIGPERDGPGINTVIKLQNDNYPNMFYGKKPGKIKGEYVKEYGWKESRENKEILASTLKRYYRDIFHETPCQFLLDESSTFIRHEDGHLGHEEGKYDDCVIGGGITLQVSLIMPPVMEMRPKFRKDWLTKRIERMESMSQDDYMNYAEQSEIGMVQYLNNVDDPDNMSDYEGIPLVDGNLVSTIN